MSVYVTLWTHKWHQISHTYGRVLGHLHWVICRKLTVLRVVDGEYFVENDHVIMGVHCILQNVPGRRAPLGWDRLQESIAHRSEELIAGKGRDCCISLFYLTFQGLLLGLKRPQGMKFYMKNKNMMFYVKNIILCKYQTQIRLIMVIQN